MEIKGDVSVEGDLLVYGTIHGDVKSSGDIITAKHSVINGSMESQNASISGKIKVYIELISILSLSLGIINLLPIPALDGGRILFVLIEIIRGGKRVSPDKERIVHSLGFALMISLLVIVTFQDIARIFDNSNIVGWQRVEYNQNCENT